MILTKSSTYRLLPTAYRLTFVKAMLSSVDAVELLRLSEKAMPTDEKRRSTVAEVAGQPRY